MDADDDAGQRSRERDRILKWAGGMADAFQQLDTMPFGVGVGMRLISRFLQQVRETDLLEPAVQNLAIEVILMKELLLTVEQRREEAQALAAAEAAVSADDPIVRHQKYWESKAGMTHTIQLRLGLRAACSAIVVYKSAEKYKLGSINLGWLKKFLGAQGLAITLSDATAQLQRARDQFCQAILVNKALGEYVAESVAQLRAQQEGNLAPGGSILLKGHGLRARLYTMDAELNKKAKALLKRQEQQQQPDTANNTEFDPNEWEDLLEGPRMCMAMTDKLIPCRRNAMEAFIVYSDTYTQEQQQDIGASIWWRSPVSDSRLVGTFEYMDPEYLRSGEYSARSDVYALGMVLLQLLQGRGGSQVVATVETARKQPLGFAPIIDPRAGPWPAAEAVAFADLALRCVEYRRQDRPDLRREPARLRTAGPAGHQAGWEG
ncbi:hypothetical protein GPECTOR_13g765 [Gonium pectorale]|uniref:Protein kinase domain-containing protein n=1 Tax=Gonium pectorale TaxID=33097 RepID=A0A150GNB9_GONPE|nr:hypothetical protein GPECTOR_13g765 [Gonium pectorale]|eukprot:KXZ51278.1 hypothetical protein GPECTOR_13g765 [Gonium pectorale]